MLEQVLFTKDACTLSQACEADTQNYTDPLTPHFLLIPPGSPPLPLTRCGSDELDKLSPLPHGIYRRQVYPLCHDDVMLFPSFPPPLQGFASARVDQMKRNVRVPHGFLAFCMIHHWLWGTGGKQL
jgi:hypothetical protein